MWTYPYVPEDHAAASTTPTSGRSNRHRHRRANRPGQNNALRRHRQRGPPRAVANLRAMRPKHVLVLKTQLQFAHKFGTSLSDSGWDLVLGKNQPTDENGASKEREEWLAACCRWRLLHLLTCTLTAPPVQLCDCRIGLPLLHVVHSPITRSFGQSFTLINSDPVSYTHLTLPTIYSV